MKILAIADEEEKALWDYYDPTKTKDVDLIISCGDLKARYLEFLETMVNCPLLYVRGNHDSQYDHNPPLGCIDIDDRVFEYQGLRILGLGGSMRYIPGREDMYTEEEMQKRIAKVNRQIVLMNGIDMVVAHSPVRGYGDLEDLPHQGFECFNSLLEKWKPRYFLHGHVHKTYSYKKFVRERIHDSGTKLINVYGHVTLDVGDDEHPAHGHTGSGLYDLYVAMKDRRKPQYMDRKSDMTES